MENLPGYVYILSNCSVSTLYVGSTSYLYRRIWEHKEKLLPNSFTSKYNINKLLYYESAELLISAREREYQIKKWSRKKKLYLIYQNNKFCKDLAEDWYNIEC